MIPCNLIINIICAVREILRSRAKATQNCRQIMNAFSGIGEIVIDSHGWWWDVDIIRKDVGRVRGMLTGMLADYVEMLTD